MTKQTLKRRATALALLVLLIILVLFTGGRITKVSYSAEAVGDPQPTQAELELEHRRQVWISALEWCESSGHNGAVNEKDLDGTPSYGAFQFKPSTLWYYAEKYGLDYPKPDEELGWIVQLPDSSLGSEKDALMNYEYQRAVVEQMVRHASEIKWEQQFPWCVKKLGRPPVK